MRESAQPGDAIAAACEALNHARLTMCVCLPRPPVLAGLLALAALPACSHLRPPDRLLQGARPQGQQGRRRQRELDMFQDRDTHHRDRREFPLSTLPLASPRLSLLLTRCYHQGTAADAMVATTLCVGTIGMYHSGIGGGGFMLVRDKDGNYETIDYRETAPAAAAQDMYKHDANASVVGGLAVAVPGELRGLEYLHRKYGVGAPSHDPRRRLGVH